MVLAQLFGSESRYKLLQLFVKNPERTFFVRELVRQTRGHMHAVRRELMNLEEIGIIRAIDMPGGGQPWGDTAPSDKKKKYYTFSPQCAFYDELRALFLKDTLHGTQECIDILQKMTHVDFLIVSGVFTKDEQASVDILVVGSPSKDAMAKAMRFCEDAFGYELRYAVMTTKEFTYRRDIVDRFIYDIIDKKHTVLIDKLDTVARM